MSKHRVSIEDIITVLFQPVPEFEIKHEKSALLLINFLDYIDFFGKTAVGAGMPEIEVNEALSDFDLRARKAADNASRVLKACRDKSFEIIHVKSEAPSEKPESTTRAKWKTGLVVPSGTEALKTYEAVRPRKGELVFPQTNREAFTGTRLDFVLRNMNVDSLIICGLMTDQDVLLNTIQAVNLGYYVTLVEDACTTLTREAHENFIKWYKTFVNVKTTEKILNLIQKNNGQGVV